MVRTRRFFSALLAIVLVVPKICCPVWALDVENDENVLNGDSGKQSVAAFSATNIIAEQERVSNDSALSEKMKESIINKLSILAVSTASTSKLSGTINVQVINQRENNYCGPATVKQTLTYINGTAADLDTIANAIGTTDAGSDLASMVSYINKNIDYDTTSNYIIVSDPSEAQIQTIIEYGVLNGLPPVCRLKFDQGGNWPYTTNGHFMNASGYRNYGGEIRVADPNMPRIDPTNSGVYLVTVNELYLATHNHFAQEMAY